MYDHAEIRAISRPICLLEHQMQKCCSFKRVYLLNKNTMRAASQPLSCPRTLKQFKTTVTSSIHMVWDRNPGAHV